MKTLSKIAAVVASAALALSALGCSSAQTSTQSAPGFEAQDIQVNDPGFAITDEGKLRFAFVAVNPNDGHVAQDVIFTIEAYDASGSMIAGGGETISMLYPGVETPGAGEADLFSSSTDTPEVASLSIVPMMDSVTWSDTGVTNEQIESAIEIVSPHMSTSDDGSIAINAGVKLKAEGEGQPLAGKEVEVRAIALLFDKSGSALCGTEPVALTLNANGDACQFEAAIPNAPEYGICNLYVTPDTLL